MKYNELMAYREILTSSMMLTPATASTYHKAVYTPYSDESDEPKRMIIREVKKAVDDFDFNFDDIEL